MLDITFFKNTNASLLEDLISDCNNWKEIEMTDNLYQELIPCFKDINSKSHEFTWISDKGDKESINLNLSYLDDEKRKNLIEKLKDFFLIYQDKCNSEDYNENNSKLMTIQNIINTLKDPSYKYLEIY